MAYVNLVYAFFGDVFIFDETFSVMQVVGILIIVLVSVAISVRSFRKG